jgi:hypothetical protein
MIDLKTAIEPAKRFVVPTLLALLILGVLLGVPLGYQYFKLQKERSALTVELKMKKAELDATNAARQAELDEKADALSAKETELNAMAEKLKKSLTLLNQNESEYQAALAKLQQEQLLARWKVKPPPLKRSAIQPPKRAASLYRKKAPSLAKRSKKPVVAKAPPPAAPPLSLLPRSPSLWKACLRQEPRALARLLMPPERSLASKEKFPPRALASTIAPPT